MTITEATDADLVRAFLEEKDAFWHWDNHVHIAQLTSGKLSDLFANCTPIHTMPRFQAHVGAMLWRTIPGEATQFGVEQNTWVIGSAMGAIGLAQAMAMCTHSRSGYTEPTDSTMSLKRFDLGKAPKVVVCEDVMSTGGTTKKTIAAILAKHPDAKINPVIPVVVDRRHDQTGVLSVGELEFKVKGILSITPRVWDSEGDLPPEMKNCVPLRPKGNWEKLKEKRNG